MHMLHGNHKDLFVRVMWDIVRVMWDTWVFTLNIMFVILKYILIKSLKLYLNMLERDVRELLYENF